MQKRILIILHLAVPFFILHFVEEIVTSFYVTDPSINSMGAHLGISALTTFCLTEITLFIFLAAMLLSVVNKKTIPLFFIAVLDVILLYEFSHTIGALRAGVYTPGFLTGTFLGIFGIGLLYVLVKGNIKKEWAF